MMRMSTYYKLTNLYKIYKGYVSTKGLMEEGLSNRQIAALTEEDYLEKVCHGCYWMKQCGYEKPDDYKCIEVCLSNPRAVIAMGSACYYLGAVSKEPEVLTVATERTDRSAMKISDVLPDADCATLRGMIKRLQMLFVLCYNIREYMSRPSKLPAGLC